MGRLESVDWLITSLEVAQIPQARDEIGGVLL
jgi:hypothetical protein